jgi:hypothetical protein
MIQLQPWHPQAANVSFSSQTRSFAMGKSDTFNWIMPSGETGGGLDLSSKEKMLFKLSFQEKLGLRRVSRRGRS